MIGDSRKASRGGLLPGAPRRAGLPTAKPRQKTLMRRFAAQWLAEEGQFDDYNRLAPASNFFESAFNAFARGTLLATPVGPVAVEDLMPGDRVETAERGPEVILWKGNLTLYPHRPGMPGQPDGLFRLTADALGYGRPMQDLLLGSGAEVWAPHCGQFIPAGEMLDGVSVIELTPPAPVTAYHICLAGRRTLLANGLAVSSYSPDEATAQQLTPEMRSLFLSLFPNLRDLEDIAALAGSPQKTRPNGFAAA